MVMAMGMVMNMARSPRPRNTVGPQLGWRWPSPVRVALAIGILLVALPVMLITTSLVEAQGTPTLAVELWPWNSLALGQIADGEFSADTPPDVRQGVREAAVRALLIEPGNVRAARSLAFLAGVNNDEHKTSFGLRYSEFLSRRDLLTQLALIELCVKKGDVVGALRHYDRALRVTESIPMLLSTMIAASADPLIRRNVITLLKQQPRWRSAFLVQLVDEQTPADTVYGFVSALRLDAAQPDERQALAAAIGKLVGLGHIADARRLLPPSSALVRNGDFEVENPFPPLDWVLTDEANLNAVIENGPSGHGHALYLNARNGRGGEIAFEQLSVPPGRYRLSLVTGDTIVVRPQITLTCDNRAEIGDHRELFSLSVPAAPSTGRLAHSEPFTVAQTCEAQRLAISMPMSLDDEAVRPWIDGVAIVPAT